MRARRKCPLSSGSSNRARGCSTSIRRTRAGIRCARRSTRSARARPRRSASTPRKSRSISASTNSASATKAARRTAISSSWCGSRFPRASSTPAQWLALDAAADRYADGSLRLTARQGVQFHYVRGHNLSALIREINASVSDNGYQLTTLGACGDVNRNTVASPIDDLDAELPLDSHELAHAVAREMAPRSSAYYQVFLADRERSTGRAAELGRADLRRAISAAQVQSRLCASARQQRRSADAGRRLPSARQRAQGHRLRSLQRRRDGRDAQPARRRCRCSRSTSAWSSASRWWRRCARSRRYSASMANAATGARRDGSTRFAASASMRSKQTLRERFGIALADAEPVPLPPVRDHLGWHREAGDGDFLYVGNSDSQRTSARRSDDSISQRDPPHRRRGGGNRRAHHAQSASDTGARSGRASRVDRADARRTRRAFRRRRCRRSGGSRWHVRRSRPAASR